MSTSTITLRALEGAPLADRAVRDMVVAAAHALAERHGVNVIDVATRPDRVTCTLEADRVIALGFAAELRRLTSAWYEHKYGSAAMWGGPEGELEGGEDSERADDAERSGPEDADA